jgi:hypothetical protein
MSGNHVVYRHYVGGVTIYIGVGSHARAVNFHNRSTAYRDYVAQHGKPQAEITHEGLSREDAHEREIELIARYGRTIDGGTLLNSARGGIGRSCPHTDEARAKMSKVAKGKIISAEQRDKIAASLRGRPGATRGRKLSPEHIEKTAAAHRGMKHSAETRAKMSISHKGKKRAPFSPEHRAAMSAARLGKTYKPCASKQLFTQGIETLNNVGVRL